MNPPALLSLPDVLDDIHHQPTRSSLGFEDLGGFHETEVRLLLSKLLLFFCPVSSTVLRFAWEFLEP